MPDPERIDSISSGSELGGVNPIQDGPPPDADGIREEREFAARKHEEELRGLKNDNDARVKYANSIFRLISLWLIAILLILLLQGFLGKEGAPYDWTVSGPYGPHANGVAHFELSSEILLALIGGTTASVLGIFTFVAKYLFPEKK